MAGRSLLKTQVVRAELQRRGWSQARLASAVGVELRTVQRWLAGRAVSHSYIYRVAAALERGACDISSMRGDPGILDPERIERLVGRLNVFEAGGLASLVAHAWAPLVTLLEFTPHPLHGYVRRLDTRHLRHRFGTLHLRASNPSQQEIEFAGQCSQRVRYRCGKVTVADEKTSLIEYAHTRAMQGETRAGVAEIWVWVPFEMSELVLSSAQPFDVVRCDFGSTGPQIFRRSANKEDGALVFRPAAGDLRRAGLPSWDDRVRDDL